MITASEGNGVGRAVCLLPDAVPGRRVMIDRIGYWMLAAVAIIAGAIGLGDAMDASVRTAALLYGFGGLIALTVFSFVGHVAARLLRDRAEIRPGDHVVRRVVRHDVHPVPGAEALTPLVHGEGYTFLVRESLTVVDVLPDGRLAARDATGHQECLRRDDPEICRMLIWEDWVRRIREEVRGGLSAA
jgi:hypothetical protein